MEICSNRMSSEWSGIVKEMRYSLRADNVITSLKLYSSSELIQLGLLTFNAAETFSSKSKLRCLRNMYYSTL